MCVEIEGPGVFFVFHLCPRVPLVVIHGVFLRPDPFPIPFPHNLILPLHWYTSLRVGSCVTFTTTRSEQNTLKGTASS